MRVFSLGGIYLVPAGANPTPVQVGLLRDVTVSFDDDLKTVQGQWRVAIDAARAALKIGIKAKFADIRGALLSAVLPGMSTVVGQVVNVAGEVGTIPSTPFQITVANGATFKEDASVYDATAGKTMTRVASAPAAGQYAVNTTTGQYTFAAADVGHSVQFFYSYTQASSGVTQTFNNAVMGAGSTSFACRVWSLFAGKPLGFYFPAVHFPKLNVPLKVDDFQEFDLEGVVVQDSASAKVFDLYVGEA